MRLFTAFVVLVLCAFAVARGWTIARFAEERSTFASDGADLDRWTSVPGLGAAALDAAVARTSSLPDIDVTRERRDRLVALLAVRPMSSSDWLSLAAARLLTAQPYAQIAAALQMSYVTGPNEGTVMWRRGAFGLLLWQALPSDGRARAIADLAGAMRETTVEDDAIGEVRAILDGRSAEVRSQIADLLRADRTSDGSLRRLGL